MQKPRPSDMPLVSTLILLAATSTPLPDAGTPPSKPPIDLAAGTSALVLLGPLSGQTSLSLDLAAHGPITQAWWWTFGGRLGASPVAPEAFARLSVEPGRSFWLPAVGLELGVTARGQSDAGSALLEEARAASRDGLAPAYVALHAVPLRFALGDRFRLSFLEMQLGTHLAPFGRFARFQLGIAGVGMTL